MKFIIPGLHNSGPNHWQTIWENTFPQEFRRINQDNWEKPECTKWINRINDVLMNYTLTDTILIGHSVGCAAIVNWYNTFKQSIGGALFVAPSDVDRKDYPHYITGFNPMPLNHLPFKTIVVASTNDHVVDINRAKFFAESWGSEFHTLENAGHIEEKSGFGEWPFGLELVRKLEKIKRNP